MVSAFLTKQLILCTLVDTLFLCPFVPESALKIRTEMTKIRRALPKDRSNALNRLKQSRPPSLDATQVEETPQKRRKTDTLSAVVTPVQLDLSFSSTLNDVNPNADEDFQDLNVSPQELRPSRTLTTGQVFHWRAIMKPNKKSSAWGVHNATEWLGVLRCSRCKGSVVVVLRETPTTCLFRVLYKTTESINVRQLLWRYFQLDEKLSDLYEQWSKNCPRMTRIAECLPGVRIVDQDAWECLVSFICSSNNNIPRITQMLAALRREYGQALLTIDNETVYTFPGPEELQLATDADLRRKCGLGYRSKYIVETVKILASLGGEPYLQELRPIKDPIIVQEKLTQFCGVGRKVADCVALFSLQQSSSIPVDVHVWNIARRDYDPENILESIKSLTPTTYKQVGDLFRERFLIKPGWAHSLLFVVRI
jgi:N-glycosylase/DNA lyase